MNFTIAILSLRLVEWGINVIQFSVKKIKKKQAIVTGSTQISFNPSIDQRSFLSQAFLLHSPHRSLPVRSIDQL